MNAALEPILSSPRIYDLVKELDLFCEEEKRRRELFYEECNPSIKAEFIQGEVIVHSPAREIHNAIRQKLEVLIVAHVEANNLGIIRGEKALCAFTRNDYEPDLCYFSPKKVRL